MAVFYQPAATLGHKIITKLQSAMKIEENFCTIFVPETTENTAMKLGTQLVHL
jgi:hypothetical protein